MIVSFQPSAYNTRLKTPVSFEVILLVHRVISELVNLQQSLKAALVDHRYCHLHEFVWEDDLGFIFQAVVLS